jgi:hypothetical protein
MTMFEPFLFKAVVACHGKLGGDNGRPGHGAHAGQEALIFLPCCNVAWNDNPKSVKFLK